MGPAQIGIVIVDIIVNFRGSGGSVLGHWEVIGVGLVVWWLGMGVDFGPGDCVK